MKMGMSTLGWTHSTISFKHMSSLYPFLELHQTTCHSNISALTYERSSWISCVYIMGRCKSTCQGGCV